MSTSVPRLRFDGISKTYPGVRALHDVSVEVLPGVVHAIVGENGAGKSTLVKILAGAVQADSGHIEIDGRRVRIRGAHSARRHGVAIVYQEFKLAPDLNVSENVLLGRWPRYRFTPLVNFSQLEARATALLQSLDITLPADRPVGDLTVAQQQMVEIAKALALDARILILDEPSAVLTPHELETLFKLVRDLKGRGVSVIYISHRLEEIFGIADAVTVLRDGRLISTRAIAGVTRGGLISEMVGRELKDEFPRRLPQIGGVVLGVAGLSTVGRFQDVDFEVRSGEVFALAGLVGSGRSSLAKTIFGAVRASAGTITIGNRRGPFSHPRQAIAAGIAMLPEDRKLEGLLLQRSLRENVTLAHRKAAAVAGFIQPARERAMASALIDDLQIRAVGTEALVETLSGGNQQKVLLARWLSMPHRVIIFDEPTRGVDVGAKYEIYTLINRLAAAGTAVVMISSELPEVIGMADRIGVMREGRLAGILDNRGRQIMQEQIMRLATGEDGKR